MENIKDIAFGEDGSLTVTLNDETVTVYVPKVEAAAPTSITLQPGQSFTVTAAAQAGN